MITIFNRKEIYQGFSMEADSSGRSSGRGLGINMDYAYEYYVYVHKNDYDQAVFLLNQK